MTQSLATNTNNDIYIGTNGNLVMFNGQNAVEQACMNASRASLGEEVLNVAAGLPFFQAVFTGVPNIAVYENYLRQALLAVDGVIAVPSLNARIIKNSEDRSVLSYTATIKNRFGLRSIIQGSIPSP